MLVIPKVKVKVMPERMVGKCHGQFISGLTMVARREFSISASARDYEVQTQIQSEYQELMTMKPSQWTLHRIEVQGMPSQDSLRRPPQFGENGEDTKIPRSKHPVRHTSQPRYAVDKYTESDCPTVNCSLSVGGADRLRNALPSSEPPLHAPLSNAPQQRHAPPRHPPLRKGVEECQHHPKSSHCPEHHADKIALRTTSKSTTSSDHSGSDQRRGGSLSPSDFSQIDTDSFSAHHYGSSIEFRRAVEAPLPHIPQNQQRSSYQLGQPMQAPLSHIPKTQKLSTTATGGDEFCCLQ